jgi:hypothetical protein
VQDRKELQNGTRINKQLIITLNENLYDRYWMDGWMDGWITPASPCLSIIHRKLNEDVETRTVLVCIITSSSVKDIELNNHQVAYIHIYT